MENRFHKGIEGQVQTHPERLSIPLKRRTPTVYSIWNDLFHEAVPFDFILAALAHAVGRYDRHKYLILTKRPTRMVEFFRWMDAEAPYRVELSRECWWWGLTVCNQQEADEKIPVFLQVPGKKFLSIEPMLGAVDFSDLFHYITPDGEGLKKQLPFDAVILGGETGPGARPMHPDWVRSVRDQCATAEVPFFFKQWGEWSPERPLKYCKLSGKRWSHKSVSWAKDGSEYNPVNPPPDHFPSKTVYRVGRKTAGRLLDGQYHNNLPWRDQMKEGKVRDETKN